MEYPISVETLFQRCREAAAMESDCPVDPDSLIGFFQTFRPDGRGLMGIFEELPGGTQLHERLDELFAATGDDRRPQGGRDAYFIIRQPPSIEPDEVANLTRLWLENLRWLALATDDAETAARLDPLPAVRVLEGIPPKHPKSQEEKADLLKTFQTSVPNLAGRIEPSSEYAQLLKPAYYFVCCDAMLRDYLMWPLYAGSRDSASPSHPAIGSIRAVDPFRPYFQLWRHGLKYRIFRDEQIDLYLPRSTAV